jgi:mono/diheme cytochrome c family protein
VEPFIAKHCVGCHGAESQTGGFVLSVGYAVRDVDRHSCQRGQTGRLITAGSSKAPMSTA